MNTAISERPQDNLQTQLERTQERIRGLEAELREAESALEQASGARERYDALADACKSLENLAELGAASLLWGSAEGGDEYLARARDNIAGYERRLEQLRHEREQVQRRLEDCRLEAVYLYEEICEAEAEKERQQDEFVVEREIVELPYRMTVMPWARGNEDDKRLRKSVLIALLASISFGYLIALWKLPPPDRNEVVEVPERLARLVREQQPEPPPPAEERPKEEEPEETEEPEVQEQEEQPEPEQPTPAEEQVAREKAEGSGILAFKDSFTDLIDNAPEPELGAKARISNAGQDTGETRRSIVASEAQSTSGGINTAELSRNVGGSSGDQIGGVEFARVESGIGTDLVSGADRPLSDGPGPSRTDEEIQIVFDRYKATLYRIYNRELRMNPTLQGKMVLRLTIEPDGSVSNCSVESTDLDSQELSAQIVERVKRFNFGPKEGVPPVTILYPIDFLPAT